MNMREFWATAAAEFDALGRWCVIHGPEIWLAIAKGAVYYGVFLLGMLVGMWLAAMLGANGRDDDE